MWGHWRIIRWQCRESRRQVPKPVTLFPVPALTTAAVPWPQVYTMLTGELCDESTSYFVAFRSEFVVSRARLRAQPLATYQKLHSYVGVRPCPRPLTGAASMRATHGRPAGWTAAMERSRVSAHSAWHVVLCLVTTLRQLRSQTWDKRARCGRRRTSPRRTRWLRLML